MHCYCYSNTWISRPASIKLNSSSAKARSKVLEALRGWDVGMDDPSTRNNFDLFWWKDAFWLNLKVEIVEIYLLKSQLFCSSKLAVLSLSPNLCQNLGERGFELLYPPLSIRSYSWLVTMWSVDVNTDQMSPLNHYLTVILGKNLNMIPALKASLKAYESILPQKCCKSS
jgi:hypothetical protein